MTDNNVNNVNNIIDIYDNWHYHLEAVDSNNKILWLAFDCKYKSVNSLSKQAISELKKIITQLSNNNSDKITALIIYSTKPSGFIAGADVTEFTNENNTLENNVKEAKTLLENGQDTMDLLEKLKITTIAMIDGFCLGGGLELSLACDYRIATDQYGTKIGLPEVMLGIIPGWGGTVRLPKLIGGLKALPLMMQGKTVGGIAAYKLGIVDACVPKRQLSKTARYFAVNNPPKRKPNFINELSNHQPFRNLFAYFAQKELVKKAQQNHYPAPFAILDKWQQYGVDGNAAYKAEVSSDLQVIQHPTARNLIKVFFLQEKLKEQAKAVKYKAAHVHVIGAGTMGGDIAAWCAFKGLKVTLQDQSYQALSLALGRAFKLFKSKVKRDDLATLMLDRIIPDVNGFGIKHADVIIEAVFENLQVKQELFKKIEAEAKPDAILATNTSSILIDEINQVLSDKSRLVGIHFFNPVPKMMLVEVVSGKVSNTTVVQQAASFVNQIGKLPLPVASSPGFLVNRVLSAYMQETFILLAEGVSPLVIDSAMKEFGMPMGPVEMVDIVGLDICLSVANNMAAYYGNSSGAEVPKILQEKVTLKHLGKKTNKGFYDYKNGKIIRATDGSGNRRDYEGISDRLVLRILNSCVECLREGVVTDADYVNAGMIFGSGFAPFRGGPMNYLNAYGVDNVLKTLKKLEAQYGSRFKPDDGFNNINLLTSAEHNQYEQA